MPSSLGSRRSLYAVIARIEFDDIHSGDNRIERIAVGWHDCDALEQALTPPLFMLAPAWSASSGRKA